MCQIGGSEDDQLVTEWVTMILVYYRQFQISGGKENMKRWLFW